MVLKQNKRWLCAENGEEGAGRKWGPVGNKRGLRCWWLPWPASSGCLHTAVEENRGASLGRGAEEVVKGTAWSSAPQPGGRWRHSGIWAGEMAWGEVRFGGDALAGQAQQGGLGSCDSSCHRQRPSATGPLPPWGQLGVCLLP